MKQATKIFDVRHAGKVVASFKTLTAARRYAAKMIREGGGSLYLVVERKGE